MLKSFYDRKYVMLAFQKTKQIPSSSLLIKPKYWTIWKITRKVLNKYIISAFIQDTCGIIDKQNKIQEGLNISILIDVFFYEKYF